MEDFLKNGERRLCQNPWPMVAILATANAWPFLVMMDVPKSKRILHSTLSVGRGLKTHYPCGQAGLWAPWVGPSYPRDTGKEKREKFSQGLLRGKSVHFACAQRPSLLSLLELAEGGDYMCCRRLEFATAQSHCNLSLFGHVLPFPKPKAVCTPEHGSSGVFWTPHLRGLFENLASPCIEGLLSRWAHGGFESETLDELTTSLALEHLFAQQ